MIKFWAIRIDYDLNRINEVPKKLQSKVTAYIKANME